MGLLREFKELTVKGNIIDLVIGVVIDAAFGAIVSPLVAGVITPLLLIPVLKAVQVDKLDALIWNGVTYGKLLTAAISFLFAVFVLFMLVRGINKLKRKQEEIPAAPAGPTREELLAEIRDLLKSK